MEFANRVAIVTGAGGGLGRAYALALASAGAKVVVNDLADPQGDGGRDAAEGVADEIRAAGGQALAVAASVTDPIAIQAMIDTVMSAWGRIDILINNAGNLRDKSFGKMTLDDFRHVLDVHLVGGFICTKAVWEIMRQQNYGRIVMTTSSSGLFGNFGQANYAAAKMGLVGLMQTLSIEGSKNDIRVNCIAPTAATRMTENIFPEALLPLLDPAHIAPGLLYLVSEHAPNRVILCAGACGFERTYITLTPGAYIAPGSDAAVRLAAEFDRISDRTGEVVPDGGRIQSEIEVNKALAAFDGARI